MRVPYRGANTNNGGGTDHDGGLTTTRFTLTSGQSWSPWTGVLPAGQAPMQRRLTADGDRAESSETPPHVPGHRYGTGELPSTTESPSGSAAGRYPVLRYFLQLLGLKPDDDAVPSGTPGRQTPDDTERKAPRQSDSQRRQAQDRGGSDGSQAGSSGTPGGGSNTEPSGSKPSGSPPSSSTPSANSQPPAQGSRPPRERNAQWNSDAPWPDVNPQFSRFEVPGIAENKRKILDALTARGATQDEKDFILAVGMVESSNLSASTGVNNGPNVESSNYGTFNMNVAQIREVYSGPLDALQNNPALSATVMLDAMRLYARNDKPVPERWTDFTHYLRGGYPVMDGTKPADTPHTTFYKGVIKRTMAQIADDPTLRTDNTRVATRVPG